MADSLATLATGTPDPGARVVESDVCDARDEWDRARAGEIAYDELVVRPMLVARGSGDVVVVDRRSRAAAYEAWIWAAWVAVTLLVAWLTFTSPWLLRGWTGLLVGGILAASGVLAWRRGRTESESQWRILARIEVGVGNVLVRGSPHRTLDDCAVIHSIDDVDEVLFASRRVRVSKTGQGDGVGIFLRFRDGSVWPIVPSTLAQGEAYQVATRLGLALRVRVKQVGLGFLD
jgi:hypothetical protein